MNILSLTYLGNIQYFTKLCCGEPFVIDIYENYLKQSYRTRCDIMTSGGVIPLTVNIIKSSNWNKATIRETRIDYSKRWQHQHWLSIVSSYKNSPYFDFYGEAFEPFYTKKYDSLFELNHELLQTVLNLLGASVELTFSQSYITPSAEDCDLRNTISPKPRLALHDPHFAPIKYYQVFSEHQPFASNMSIIDLLFCEGPSALDIIGRSTVK